MSGEEQVQEQPKKFITKKSIIWFIIASIAMIGDLLEAGLLHEDVRTIAGDGLRRYTGEPKLDDTGEVIWRDVFNVFQTDIPAPRVGWAAMAGDEETGNVYVHSVDGIFRCYDADGKVLWEHSLFEDLGKISGYGELTH